MLIGYLKRQCCIVNPKNLFVLYQKSGETRFGKWILVYCNLVVASSAPLKLNNQNSFRLSAYRKKQIEQTRIILKRKRTGWECDSRAATVQKYCQFGEWSGKRMGVLWNAQKTSHKSLLTYPIDKIFWSRIGFLYSFVVDVLLYVTAVVWHSPVIADRQCFQGIVQFALVQLSTGISRWLFVKEEYIYTVNIKVK